MLVTLRLRHDADINSRYSCGTQLNYLAAQQRRNGLVHHLQSLGADVNARDVSGTPLLVEVVKDNDHVLVHALLEHGGDPDANNIYGQPPILLVLRDRNLSAVDRELLAEIVLLHGARGNRKHLWVVTVLEQASTERTLAGKRAKALELLQNQQASSNQ